MYRQHKTEKDYHYGDQPLLVPHYNFVAALECDKLHPSIENGRVSTLESAESDINGAQANYSCNDGCELEGSKSLRCQIVVTGHIATSQWVNDTEQNKMPSCSCPPPGRLYLPQHSCLNL